MEKSLSTLFETIQTEASKTRFSAFFSEEGKVLSVGDGIVQISGLRDAKLYELIRMENGDEGIVFDLYRESIGVVLLTQRNNIKAGERVFKTDLIASVMTGDGLLGRTVDALGTAIDGGPPIEDGMPYPVERKAPSLIQRDFVTTPLYTGLKVIDSMLSIGRGQRELIIGDPSTGKTSIAIDTIINQKDSDVISIYTAIGQKASRVLKIVDEVKKYGDISKTIFVAANASDSVGQQYIAPYSATAIAEFFLEKGKDVLIIYDDLTKHAKAYRSLSLLLRRPPGREAYPGDIFYIHSRLLERSAKLHQKYGGGSITALPIVETQQGRISSYIPTNLISITDGQIYLDTGLFNKGTRPAVDVGKSVSRIGGKAQIKAMKVVAERLKIDYSRFTEVEMFTKFGAHVEEETAKLIRRGERMRELLKQPQFQPFSVEEEFLSLLVLETGVLDELDLDAVNASTAMIIADIITAFPKIISQISTDGEISPKDMGILREFIYGQGRT